MYAIQSGNRVKKYTVFCPFFLWVKEYTAVYLAVIWVSENQYQIIPAFFLKCFEARSQGSILATLVVRYEQKFYELEFCVIFSLTAVKTNDILIRKTPYFQRAECWKFQFVFSNIGFFGKFSWQSQVTMECGDQNALNDNSNE